MKKNIFYPISCFSGCEVTSPFEQRFITEEKVNKNISSIQTTKDVTNRKPGHLLHQARDVAAFLE
jgi:uncharacterized protein YvpB